MGKNLPHFKSWPLEFKTSRAHFKIVAKLAQFFKNDLTQLFITFFEIIGASLIRQCYNRTLAVHG